MPKTLRVTLPTLHQAQQQIKRERRRFNVIDAGRRIGKNVLLQDLAIEAALVGGKPTGWAAPTYKHTLDDWRTLDNVLAQVITRRSVTELRFDLASGGSIEFWSLDKPDSIRGKKYARFIVNEAGMVAKLIDDWNFIIRPTLIDLRGDAYFAGTPKGRNGFWQLFNTEDAEWMRWQMSSYANPHIPPGELDALRITMSERAFRQEILGEFIEDGAGVFRKVQEAATAKGQSEAAKGHIYVCGCDWGRTNDATVFAVIDRTINELVYLDRMTETDYALQVARLTALASRFRLSQIVAESNSMGGPLTEQLQGAGLPVVPFNTTNATKAQAVDALILAFENSTLKIINDAVLVAELQAYESERLPSGQIRYSAPEGMHDDCVMALALANTGVAGAIDDPFAGW